MKRIVGFVLFFLFLVSCKEQKQNGFRMRFALEVPDPQQYAFISNKFEDLIICIDTAKHFQVAKWKGQGCKYGLYNRNGTEVLAITDSDTTKFYKGDMLIHQLAYIDFLTHDDWLKGNGTYLEHDVNLFSPDSKQSDHESIHHAAIMNHLWLFPLDRGIPFQILIAGCPLDTFKLQCASIVQGVEQDFAIPNNQTLENAFQLATGEMKVEEKWMEVKGTIREMTSGEELQNVLVAITNSAGNHEYHYSNCQGEYNFNLTTQDVFTISYSLPGKISKRVLLDYRNVVPIPEGYLMVLDGTLFSKTSDRQDFSFLNEPIAKFELDTLTGEIWFDENYVSMMKSKIDSVLSVH